MIKLFLLFRRVVGGALDLDVEDGYKTTEVHSNTTFADVVGVDEAKKELEDIVAYLKARHIYLCVCVCVGERERERERERESVCVCMNVCV